MSLYMWGLPWCCLLYTSTSYCYTSEDGDGSGNSLVGTDDIVKGYPATVQSQATMAVSYTHLDVYKRQDLC